MSSVWKNFIKLSKSEAKCKKCDATLKCSGGSTSSLKRHFQKFHFDVLEPSTGNDSKKQKTMLDYKKVLSIDKEIAKLCCKDGFSFRGIAESEFIQKSLKMFSYDKTVSTSNVGIKNHMMNYYYVKKTELANYFENEVEKGVRYSVTTDEYTSKQNRRYANINVHSIDKFWNLGLVRIKGKFDSQSAINIVSTKLKSFNLSLERDIVSCTTDGASVMIKFGSNIEPLHQQCLAHAINLSICDALYKSLPPLSNVNTENNEEDNEDELLDNNFEIEFDDYQPEINDNYKNLIDKVRKIAKLFRKSPLKNDFLQDYVKEINNGQPLNLILDTKTRWNSMLHMLERAYKLKDCISKFLISIEYSDLLTEEEWKQIDKIINVLKPLEIVIKELSTTDSSLLKAESSFVFIMTQIKEDSNLSTILKKSLLERFLSRRQKDATSFLKYLHNPMQEVNSNFPISSKISMKKFAENLYHRLFPYDTSEEDDDDLNADPTPISNGCSEEDLLKKYYSEYEKIMFCPSSRRSQSYFDATKEFKIFEATKKRTPKLERLCNALLTIKPTSVEAERAFSTAGLFLSKIRSSLSDETLDAQVFLKSYFINNE